MNIERAITDLIEISHFYGTNSDFIIAGGGNTSYKTKDRMWVKASGTTLADINQDGFVEMNRSGLKKISNGTYSDNPAQRELEIKNDLMAARVEPDKGLRPSVEASLHEIISYSYIVHTHPYLINSVLCSKNALKLSNELFGEKILFIPYTDPGYTLFKKVKENIADFNAKYNTDPQIILLENHGIFVGADTCSEIKEIYKNLVSKINSKINTNIEQQEIPVNHHILKLTKNIKSIIGFENKHIQLINNKLINNFIQDKESFNKVSLPFTPDNIVYCKAAPMWVPAADNIDDFLTSFKKSLEHFKKIWKYEPKAIIVENGGLAAIEENEKSVKIIIDMFIDLMKIYTLTEKFGGPKYMNQREIDFIDNWEVENYRRQMAKK